ncbi:MAG: hypothetical protein MK135_02225 [Polyangiaceae bacterium]|nr:hypothetical protein [Polyangiaceae bacterium]
MRPAPLSIASIFLVLGIHPVAEARVRTLGAQQQSTATERGRPQIHLDRLDLPAQLERPKATVKTLRKALYREAQKADWGAGPENRIEFRFKLVKFDTKIEGRVLRVSCEGWGQLPGGQKAKSELSFGGKIGEGTALRRQVLEIVARGVITRLSQMERRRRGLAH